MLTCKQTTELLSQAVDVELTVSQKLLLRAHLVICSSCRAVQDQFQFLHRAMQRYRGDEDVAASRSEDRS